MYLWVYVVAIQMLAILIKCTGFNELANYVHTIEVFCNCIIVWTYTALVNPSVYEHHYSSLYRDLVIHYIT